MWSKLIDKNPAGTSLQDKKLSKEAVVCMLKVIGMWVLGSFWFLAFVWFDSNVVEGWFLVWFFATLWVPFRWDRHMPEEMLRPSWADTHDIT